MTDEELIAALREGADRVEPLARVPGCVPHEMRLAADRLEALTGKPRVGWGAKVDDMILAMRETETDFRNWSPEAQDEIACAALEAALPSGGVKVKPTYTNSREAGEFGDGVTVRTTRS